MAQYAAETAHTELAVSSVAAAAENALPLHGEKGVASRHAFTVMPSLGRYISSDTMATLIDSEVQSILHEGRATACTVLSEHYDQLTRLAYTLMEHEQLDRTQFEAILQE